MILPQRPKKSLGQNFLIDKNIQAKILASCGFNGSETVLEIGAGSGELTERVAPRVKRVYALELDTGLCKALKNRLAGFVNTTVINRDILKFDVKRHFPAGKKTSLRLTVIGNIPYYITTPIIEYLLNNRRVIDRAYLTVQKEFARRIVSRPGSKEYGSLSCFVQYYAQPQIMFPIKRTSFYPQPSVDSCLLRLVIKGEGQDKALSPSLEKFLFKIIRAAFNKRRKTLRNSLSGIVAKERLDAFFAASGIDCNIRPESLSLNDFVNLAKSEKFHKKKLTKQKI